MFGVSEIEFLGYQVDCNGIKPLAHRVEAIKNFTKPLTIKQLRRFLGMINFYFYGRKAHATSPRPA